MSYSELLMDHFLNPRNGGKLEAPDLTGTAGIPYQGNFVVIEVRLADGRIAEARFQCHGCGPTIACASYLTTLLEGRTLAECACLTEEALSEALGIPAHKQASPRLVIEALRGLAERA